MVQLWDAATFAPLRAFTFAYPVHTAALCPARGRFAVGGADMWAHLHDLATGEELGAPHPVQTSRTIP